MTPLAHRIVRELTFSVRDRKFVDHGGILKLVSGMHCFEATDVFEMAHDLAKQMQNKERIPDDVLAFLPADKTWIEWRTRNGHRLGVLLVLHESGDFADAFPVVEGKKLTPDEGKVFSSEGSPLMLNPVGLRQAFPGFEGFLGSLDHSFTWMGIIYGLLALINTPRVVGRKQHMPHLGLQRDLLRHQKAIGSFPLHAWTELTLDCRPPEDLSDAEGYDAHLTGRKCLHFCRAHLRLRNGRVEFVSAHWRGDGSLGIKQTRYRLTR